MSLYSLACYQEPTSCCLRLPELVMPTTIANPRARPGRFEPKRRENRPKGFRQPGFRLANPQPLVAGRDAAMASRTRGRAANNLAHDLSTISLRLWESLAIQDSSPRARVHSGPRLCGCIVRRSRKPSSPMDFSAGRPQSLGGRIF